MFKILVCGGRDFNDKQTVDAILGSFRKTTKKELAIIHGAAKGADALAGQWAEENQVLELTFPANWQKHGKAAGPIRNQQMIDLQQPDIVVAFPGGKGTADMVNRAQQHDIPVMFVDPQTKTVEIV